MAYTKTQWNSGDPITQERMNKIEEGIENAHKLESSINAAASTANTAASTANTNSGKIDVLETSLANLQTAVEQNAQFGQEAMTQIHAATDSNNPAYENLDSRFTAIENAAATEKTYREATSDSVNEAKRNSADSLVKRFQDVESNVSTLESAYNSLNTTITNAGNGGSLSSRLNNDEARIKTVEDEILDAHGTNEEYVSLDNRFNIIQNELKAAHESTAYSKTASNGNAYTSLDARFEAIESEIVGARSGQSTLDGRLDNIENNASALSNDKIDKTSIANNLTTTAEGRVLDARQGKALDDKKVNYTDIVDDTVSTDADKPLSANQGKLLRDALTTLDNSTDSRLDALEAEVDMASNDGERRLDVIEGRLSLIDGGSSGNNGVIDTINTKIETIATELGMLDNGSIVSADTRVDTIESDVTTIKSDLNTTTTGLKDRMTTAEDDIDTLESDLNTATTGLKDRMTTAETNISTLNSDLNAETTGIKARLDALDNASTGAIKGLDDRLDAIDGGSALDTTNGTLAQRVTNLESKDTIVIAYDGEHSNYTEGTPNISNPSTDADYLIEDDEGKYFYWRYFGAVDGWQLVGGAGGSGNGSSSGVILAALPSAAEGDPNIDYFIGTDALGYIHYRFIAAAAGESEGHYIRILPNNLIGDLSVNQYGGLVAHTIGDDQTNLLANFYALKGVTYTPNYDPQDPNTLVSQTLQFTRTDGETLDPIVIVGGGGGGGAVYSINIESSTPASRSIPANSTDPVTITAKVVMKQGNEILGSGAIATGKIQYRVYGASTWNTGDDIEVESLDPALRYVIPNNTNFTVDVSKYLEDDKTIQIRLAIIALPAGEGTEVERYQTFNISKVNISIAAEAFDYASVKNSNFQFNYRCFGSGINKTVHFVMDGSDIATANVGTSHNTVLQQLIPMTGKSNGMHTFEVYFVTSTGLQSNKLNYFILYNTDNTREAPLLGAAAENTSIVDGDELVVNYSVSTIGSETTDSLEIELYTLGENDVKNTISTVTLNDVPNNVLADPPYHTFDYPKVERTDPNTIPDPITVYVKLTATHNGLSDSKTVSVQVRYLDTKYNLELAGKNNLLYEYVAYGHSNNDAVKNTYTYPYTTVGGQEINFVGTFTDFNWATDGYLDGESLTIGGGATHTINVPIFNGSFNGINIEENANVQDITQNGRTIEIDYEVLSTTDLNATIVDCMSAQNIGFRITPQNCYLLNSSSNIDIDDTGFIKNEENVAAAYLSPGERTHLTFVIEPWAADLAADGNYHQSTNIYINGEFANACPYNRNSTTGNLDGNNFSTNATISIGSDTCLIKLYSIRLYNRGLTESQVLHNYEVSPVATRNKLNRLEDNDVLNEQGLVDYEKARKKYNCLLLTGMGTVNGNAVPTMAPYKGYPSVVGRLKDNNVVGKTESGLLLTKPDSSNTNGYSVEFDLQDRMIDPDNQYGYASSNNVQGTSSQKFPVKNLKVYLAKGDDTNVIAFDTNTDISTKKVYKYSINTAAANAYKSVYGTDAALPEYITGCGDAIATVVKNMTETPTSQGVADAIVDYLTDNDADVGAAYVSPGDELITHPILGYKKSKKVKYALRENGLGESTLCWKADYMSTDHANTFNANIANTLYTTEDRLSDRWTDQSQYTVYGIKCLLFQQNGENGTIEFVGDGCLNNDKGNNKTFALETEIEGVWVDENNNTMCQKWDFRNNTDSLLFFKHDGLFEQIDGKPAASRCLECIYPDEGDLADAQDLYKKDNNGATDPTLDVNYNHFQILSSWLGNRANYWYESDSTARATKKQRFIDEFRYHFNLNHILIYYLFMEYTALCDNRVKNIHMRTDNAGEEKIKILNENNYYFEGNSNPNSGPWTLAENLETRTKQEPILDENGDYQFDQSGNMVLGNVSHTFVKDSVLDTIDWQQGEGHSNFAIWAPVLYDLDSCFSADNVGYLKIRYDAKWNYSLYNKLKFAGYDSILWLQVEDCFQAELREMAKRLYDRVTGLNYSTFYRQQITDNLNSLCPAITNQDMILKYEKPWTEGFLDYSQDVLNPPTSTDKYKYLQRGTRAMQKAIFMKQRSLLLSSKYDANEFKQDKITFRAGTEVNKDYAVLTLVANQKLYHGVQYGDQNDVNKVTRRATKIYDEDTNTWNDITDGLVPAFVPCRVYNIGNMGNTDGIEIYGASVLNDIGDISRFHPWQVKVGSAVNLKKLILGSSAEGYSNTMTADIDGLSACALLEEINVCNCKQLTSLQLSNNGFIKKVYATGSGLKTLSLPHGGVLDTVAYSESTTDITIINQGRLTNFSYENSDSNNYTNVTRLWIENTPNVPVKDIITARLTPTNSVDQGLRAGGLRIIGINLDLGSDPSFLQLLVSDLAKGSYLTARGGHTEGNEDYPTITGTIRITSIRRSLLNKLNEIYPNLTINAVDITEEFEVTYENYDGTLLYTDHGTNDDYLKDPVYDINPITNMPYISMPTKPDDVQYEYRFGTYDNQGKYRRFSGWVRKGTSTNPTSGSKINGSITLVAVYPTVITRQYRVTWYDELNGTSLRYTDVDYGDDLSGVQTPIELGLLTRTKSTGNGVKVFNGWSRPLGKITGNVDVYALWQSSTINDTTETIVLEELTAADLYALSLTENDTKKRLLQDQLGQVINVPMGQDFNYIEGVQITNLLNGASYLELDGTTEPIRIFNNIQPLSANKDWTLAIDYKFLMNAGKANFTGTEYVLASCYQNANSAIIGFKLSMVRDSSTGHHAIQVTWGTQTQIIDYACTDNELDDKRYFNAYRNVVVLSHNTEEPNVLRISYVLPNTTNQYANQTTETNKNPYGANYGTTVTNTLLTWANNAAIDTPLILGGNYSGSTTTIEDDSNFRQPAQAMIYWAKYWDTDLGESNCSKLAAWPHETVPFYLSGYNGSSDSKSTELIYNGTRLSFVAAQGIGDRYFYSTSAVNEGDADGYFGWHQSGMRTLCNSLVYQGLPEAYKSVINNTNVTSIVRKSDLTGTIAKYTSDYMFLPAVREVNPNAQNTDTHGGEVNTSWTSPWSWMVPANKTNVFGFVTGRTDTVEVKTATINAYLYRFLGHYITDGARIFSTGATDPTGIRNLKLQDSNGATTNITVRSGDVWIDSSNEAYMYFTAEEIAQGIKINISTTNGGWKRADIWNLRSLNVSGQSTAENTFMRVESTGALNTQTGGTNNRSEGRLICPEFTV